MTNWITVNKKIHQQDALRAFIKPFKSPQRSGKIKVKVFFLTTTF